MQTKYKETDRVRNLIENASVILGNDYKIGPPRWSSGQHVLLLIMRSRVQFPARPQILNVD